jgi:hypothetical protein
MSIEIKTGINRGIDTVKSGISEKGIAIKCKIRDKWTEYKSHDHTVRNKIAISAGMTVGFFFLYEGMNVATLTGLMNAPCVKEVVESSPNAMFFGSFALDYGASFLDGLQNLRLLRNPKIGTSPNIAGTIAFYTAEKVIPKRRTIKSLVTAMGPSLISENPGFFFAGLFDEQMRSKIAMTKLFTAGVTLAQVVGKEVFLHTLGRKKRDKKAQATYSLDRKGERVNPAGVVFEIAKSSNNK